MIYSDPLTLEEQTDAQKVPGKKRLVQGLTVTTSWEGPPIFGVLLTLEFSPLVSIPLPACCTRTVTHSYTCSHRYSHRHTHTHHTLTRRCMDIHTTHRYPYRHTDTPHVCTHLPLTHRYPHRLAHHTPAQTHSQILTDTHHAHKYLHRHVHIDTPHTHTHRCSHIQTHTLHTHMQMHTTHTDSHMDTLLYTDSHTDIHTHRCTQTYTHRHTQAYSHTHTNTHTRTHSSRPDSQQHMHWLEFPLSPSLKTKGHWHCPHPPTLRTSHKWPKSVGLDSIARSSLGT